MQLFDLQGDYVKTLIKDTIETYSNQWRIIHEAVQNSHDAIQLNDAIDQGLIVIDFHLGTNKIVVIDNGKGIPLDEFPTIFTLGGTVKKDSDLRKLLKGSQGVGIKATVFTSVYFEVETTYSEGKWSKKVENCCNFDAPDFDDYVEDPTLEQRGQSNIGTRVSYSINNYSVKDFFDEIINEYCIELNVNEIQTQRELLNLIELYFRTQTYLGCVQSLLGTGENLKPIQVKVNVIFDYPTLEDHKRNAIQRCPFTERDELFGRVLRKNFMAIYSDFQEIHRSLRRSHQVNRLFTHISEVIENPPDPNMKKILIHKFTDEQTKFLLYRIRREQSTNRFRLVEDSERLQKHQRLLEKINGAYLVIGPRPYLNKYLHLSPKQQISVNGLPTNIALNTPRGAGELGYLLNIHLVLDLDTTLGYGKRNIPSVVKGQADSFFADSFNLLRRLAKSIVGERESIEPGTERWDERAEYDNFIAPDNPFKDLDIPLKLSPREEQDVICLFHELISQGRLQGYFPFRSSTTRTYDALMYFSTRPDSEIPAEINWTDLKIVEFKLKLSGLINDFNAEKKDIRDIDLVVVWEDDYDEDEYPKSSLERDGIVPFPGAQKRIRSGTQSCQILVLKEFLFESEE